MNKVAILDNSVLANFIDSGQLSILEKARQAFKYFLIPQEICREFLSVSPAYLIARERFAQKLRIDQGFYRLCTTVDPIVMGLLQTQKGVDAGEAEAIAQAVKRNVMTFFTDDRRCEDYIRRHYSHIRCYNSLIIVAILDLLELLPDVKTCWKNLHKFRGFQQADVRAAYERAARDWDIKLDKPDLWQKARW